MQWYYLSDTHERIAISEAQFLPLAARGVLRPATPVWCRGMADWSACGEVKPEIFTAAVVRHSGDAGPGAESALARGTVIGLARTWAEYRIWLRVAGALLLGGGVVLFAAMGWQAWLLIDERAAEIHRWLPFHAELGRREWLDWSVFGLLGFEALTALLGVLAGWFLLRAAAGALAARESGNELLLHHSLRRTGRCVILAVVWTAVVAVGGLGLTLWLGWEKAFPAADPAEAPRLNV